MLISVATAVALNITALILSITAAVIFILRLLTGHNERWPIAVNAVLFAVATAIWTFTYLMIGGVSFTSWVGVLIVGLIAVVHLLKLMRPPS